MFKKARKISWFALAAVVVISAVIYICPMASVSVPFHDVVFMCPAGGLGGSGNTVGVSGCASAHFAAAWQTLVDLPNVAYMLNFVWLGFAMTFIYLAYKAEASKRILSRLNNWRSVYRRYECSIKKQWLFQFILFWLVVKGDIIAARQ